MHIEVEWEMEKREKDKRNFLRTEKTISKDGVDWQLTADVTEIFIITIIVMQALRCLSGIRTGATVIPHPNHY